MPKIFQNIKLGLDEELDQHISWLVPDYNSYHVLRKSVDARKKHQGDPHFIYSVEVYEQGESSPNKSIQLTQLSQRPKEPILVVGAGPAGLFATLRLLERGIPCHLFEQGSPAEKRIFKINRFWRYGLLDTKDNVGFGEGGAGLYSDGKLITRIKSPHIPYVLQRLVEFGAPDEIRYLSNPHVGSDKIRRLIPRLRQRIYDLGGQIYFNTEIKNFLFNKKAHFTGLKCHKGQVYSGSHCILATGHSSDEIFLELQDKGVALEGKSFAMGLRVEHPQQLVNKIQYADFHDHPKLGSANYKLTHHNHQSGIGVYSFCMCPGGYVLSSGTKPGQLVTNGMSNFNRNSKYANSALVVSINHNLSFGAENIFAGLHFRNQLERQAYQMVQDQGGSKQLPKQRVVDFIERKLTSIEKGSTPSGAVPARLDQLFGETLYESLQNALFSFDQKMKGFIHREAQFYGVESRTSCPIRILRNSESLESISHPGLFPTGEGAGYAGGITSAACDGIRVAERIYEKHLSQTISDQ